MAAKDGWVKEHMDRLRREIVEKGTQGMETQTLSSKIAKIWAKRKWDERWKHYLHSIPAPRRTPAHDCRLERQGLHRDLRKAESSLAIQLRTEKIGFAAFLHARRVPGVLSPACQCGWRRQDPKHIVVFCPDHMATQDKLYEEAGTRQYLEMLSTRRGLRAVARWMMREGLLHQFSLAREQMDRAERGATKGENVVEGEEETEGATNQASEFESEMTRAE